jgi:hypothetical protein
VAGILLGFAGGIWGMYRMLTAKGRD